MQIVGACCLGLASFFLILWTPVWMVAAQVFKMRVERGLRNLMLVQFRLQKNIRQWYQLQAMFMLHFKGFKDLSTLLMSYKCYVVVENIMYQIFIFLHNSCQTIMFEEMVIKLKDRSKIELRFQQYLRRIDGHTK